MQQQFNKIKADLAKFLREYAEKKGGIRGVTIVGSHASEKKMEQMNDLDIVVVFEKISKKTWDEFVSALEVFARDRSSDGIGIVVETRLGPFKTASIKPVTIQIHALIYTVERIRWYAENSPLIALDWQRFPALVGDDLKVIAPMQFITPKQLIKARGGIDYYLEVLREKVNITVTPSFDVNGNFKQEIVKESQNNEQQAEICYKGIKNVLSDVRKLKTQKNEKATDAEVEDLARVIFTSSQTDQFEKLHTIYNRARGGEEIPKRELIDAQKQAQELLTILRTYVDAMK